MIKELFTLSPTDRFRIKENNFIVLGYKFKGAKKLVLEALDSKNKKCCFKRSFKVKHQQQV